MKLASLCKSGRLDGLKFKEVRKNTVSPIVQAALMSSSQRIEECFCNCTLKDKLMAFRVAIKIGNPKCIHCFVALFSREDSRVRFSEEKAGTEGLNALYCSALYGDEETIESVLKKYPDVININNDNLERTALFLAIHNSNLPAVRALVKKEINPDAVDEDGNTALHLAALKKAPEIHQALVESGRFDLTRKNNNGLTADQILTLLS